MNDRSADVRAFEREIVELHQFFADWFNGSLDDTDEAFARFERVLDPRFVIVGPDGSMHDRTSILALVRDAHASVDPDQPMRIWVQSVRVGAMSRDHAIVTYEEWQERAGASRGRLSTAIFQPADEAPNGVRWLHVHETWLPADATD